MRRKIFLLALVVVLLISVSLSGCISSDSDGDGLSDSMENNGWSITVYHVNGTNTTKTVSSNPNKIDTDGDGLDDYQEFVNLTDPSKADTDGDGINDNEEYSNYNTRPQYFDTWQITVRNQTYRVVADYSKYSTSPKFYDTDDDGLSDKEEFNLGTDPSQADTDGDGTEDFFDPDPFWDLSLDVELHNFTLSSSKDVGGGADVYFNLLIGDELFNTKTWAINTGENKQLNYVRNVDFSDVNAFEEDRIKVAVSAQDEDPGGAQNHDTLSINGSGETYLIYFDINTTQAQHYTSSGDDGTLNFSLQLKKT